MIGGSHDCFQTIPRLDRTPAICLAITNIFLPGIGTIIGAYIGKDGMQFDQVFIGLFQLLLTLFIIGWIWSIHWG